VLKFTVIFFCFCKLITDLNNYSTVSMCFGNENFYIDDQIFLKLYDTGDAK